MRPHSLSRARGCLLGGAVGDALGAPVEFLSLDEIRARYGRDGIAELDRAYGRVGAITDDTQMTLFTAEGLIRAALRSHYKGICYPPGVVHHAYLRWLHTQGETSAHAMFDPDGFDGWLIHDRRLFARRAPGNTCLSALHGEEHGYPDAPLNDSKGCGGVMRVAPVGLIAEPYLTYELGVEIAALTHGHPSGYHAAGALAVMISVLYHGATLDEAVSEAIHALAQHDDAGECLDALHRVGGIAGQSPAEPETVERFGAGWVAEEALAIAVFAARVALRERGTDDPEATFAFGVRLAVNHSGDSDSTGAIAGHLLGTLFGEDAIPQRWRESVELADVALALADDLHLATEDIERLSFERYPGW